VSIVAIAVIALGVAAAIYLVCAIVIPERF
jgi:phage shock protein PspC (stress-responsive transcriptional regulator)